MAVAAQNNEIPWEERLDTAKYHFDNYCNDQLRLTEEAKAGLKALLQESRVQRSKLFDEREVAIRAAQDISEAEAREQAEEAECLAALEELKATKESLPLALKEIMEACSAQRENLEVKAQALEEREKKNRYKMQQLLKGKEFFEKNLGLEFQRIEDSTLRFVFTQIDPEAPEKKFAFTVKVDENDFYIITNCNPLVPRLDEIVAALNKSNNLGAFCKKMRTQFKSLCVVSSTTR